MLRRASRMRSNDLAFGGQGQTGVNRKVCFRITDTPPSPMHMDNRRAFHVAGRHPSKRENRTIPPNLPVPNLDMGPRGGVPGCLSDQRVLAHCFDVLRIQIRLTSEYRGHPWREPIGKQSATTY